MTTNTPQENMPVQKWGTGLFIAILLAIIVIWLSAIFFFGKKTENQPNGDKNIQGQSQNVESPIKPDNTEEENPNNNPALFKSEFDEKLINPANPLGYDYVVVYDQACREAQDESCDLVKLNQFIWMEFQQPVEKIAYVNNKHKDFVEIAKKLDLNQGSPILFLSTKAIDALRKQIANIKKLEQFKNNPEAQEQFKKTEENLEKEFPKGKDRNGFYAISLSTWLIDKKNVCDKEDDWTKFDTCAVAYYIYDKDCPSEQFRACDKSVIEDTKKSIGKRFFLKALEKNDEEAKDYLALNKQQTFPFLVLKFKDNRKAPNFFIETLKAREELVEVWKDTYYALPSFLKTEWKEGSKICTPDTQLLTDTTKYQPCSNEECVNSKACIPEIKEKVDIYVMGYCPFCKDVLKQLKKFKKDNPKANIEITHLLQASTEMVENLNDLLSLHWPSEVVEDARQHCLKKEMGESKLFDYYELRFKDENVVDETNLKDVYAKLNFSESDIKKIDTCIALPLTAQELAEKANKAIDREVNATPTYIINNKTTVMGGYTQMKEAYEKAN